MKQYRNNGAIGALLDEYENAIQALQAVTKTISQEELITIVDPTTNDEDCKSIQTILTHVVRSGYWYTQEIRKSQGEALGPPRHQVFDTIEQYIKALDGLMTANIQLFEDYPTIPLETLGTDGKMLVSWKQHYDVEQLMEHAIVHILRHRRQIERFLQKLRHSPFCPHKCRFIRPQS